MVAYNIMHVHYLNDNSMSIIKRYMSISILHLTIVNNSFQKCYISWMVMELSFHAALVEGSIELCMIIYRTKCW